MKFYEDKLYIKMCKTAEEIQNIWKSLSKGKLIKKHLLFNNGFKGSFFLVNNEIDIVDDKHEYMSLDGHTEVWLPRQDELQEIIIKHADENTITWGDNVFNLISSYPISLLKLVDNFAQKDNKIRYYFLSINRSARLEIIWLSYLMKLLYNKTFNGKKWEEDKR